MPIVSIIVLFLGAALLIWSQIGKNNTKVVDLLREVDASKVKVEKVGVKSAVDYNALMEQTSKQKLLGIIKRKKRQIGDNFLIKVIVFYLLVLVAAYFINERYLRVNVFILLVVAVLGATIFMAGWLTRREMNEFEDGFPDALNLLVSAVTAGDSITHAIIFVGDALDSNVGKEFKWMGERLRMGESTDVVLSKACEHYPYPSFVFFVITIRANISRGGQLKQVIMNLNRIMFNARATQKKKMALTSEARVSTKIVGAIPFLFLVYMQFSMPDTYEFIMFTDEGRPFLYYMLASECIGFGIVKLIMSGV